MGHARRNTIIGASCLAALGLSGAAAVGSSGSGGESPAPDVVIAKAIDSIPPNCRMIAMRRLKHQLDDGGSAYLTRTAVARVVEPLRAGGSDLCDTITSQRSELGGS